MQKTTKILRILISLLMIFFGLNIFFDFIDFNSKVNPGIIILLILILALIEKKNLGKMEI